VGGPPSSHPLRPKQVQPEYNEEARAVKLQECWRYKSK
jgi:hypothetical protein